MEMFFKTSIFELGLNTVRWTFGSEYYSTHSGSDRIGIDGVSIVILVTNLKYRLFLCRKQILGKYLFRFIVVLKSTYFTTLLEHNNLWLWFSMIALSKHSDQLPHSDVTITDPVILAIGTIL